MMDIDATADPSADSGSETGGNSGANTGSGTSATVPGDTAAATSAPQPPPSAATVADPAGAATAEAPAATATVFVDPTPTPVEPTLGPVSVASDIASVVAEDPPTVTMHSDALQEPPAALATVLGSGAGQTDAPATGASAPASDNADADDPETTRWVETASVPPPELLSQWSPLTQKIDQFPPLPGPWDLTPAEIPPQDPPTPVPEPEPEPEPEPVVAPPRQNNSTLHGLVALGLVSAIVLTFAYSWKCTFKQACGSPPPTPAPTQVAESTITPPPPPPTSPPDPCAPSGRLAFADDRDGDFDIYVMKAVTQEIVALTSNRFDDRYPAFSPDGSHVLYSSKRGGNWDLYLAAVDGPSERRLTNDPAEDVAPAWLPDGNRVTFESARDGRRALYLMEVDGPEVDGGSVIPVSASSIETGQPIAVDGDLRAAGSGRAAGGSAMRAPSLSDCLPSMLSDQALEESCPSRSPDGSQLVYATGGMGGGAIAVVNREGGGAPISIDTKGLDWGPHWSPDGAFIAFTQNLRGTSHVFIARSDGSCQQALGGRGRSEWPSWGP